MDTPRTSRGADREPPQPMPSRSWLGGMRSSRGPGALSPSRSITKEDKAPDGSRWTRCTASYP
eukprot:4686847-Pyramimonas_sp.AAC.1